jgi:hypothetical protein
MRGLGTAVLLGSIALAACNATSGAPVPAESPTAFQPSSVTAKPEPSDASATQAPKATPKPTEQADPLPDAFIGAWYHPAPAFWWFLRAGSPTCVTVAHTTVDCVAYQLGTQAAYVGAAAMDGRLIRIHWTRGYCAAQETDFGTGISGDTLKLFDTEGDCGGDNFVLTRAGTGTAPSAPPPPED